MYYIDKNDGFVTFPKIVPLYVKNRSFRGFVSLII